MAALFDQATSVSARPLAIIKTHGTLLVYMPYRDDGFDAKSLQGGAPEVLIGLQHGLGPPNSSIVVASDLK
jgi:hypothetical protein